jgi:single-stranded DNA-binding protein
MSENKEHVHLHSILVIGEVSREVNVFETKNGNSCARFEVSCKKTTKYSGAEKTTLEKYVVVTFSKTMIETIVSKLEIGTVVAVNGEHSMTARQYNNNTYYASEIMVPNAQWGGAIRILSNLREDMCCIDSNVAADNSIITEGQDEVPF